MPRSLEIDHATGDDNDQATADNDHEAKPLGERVVEAIQATPDRTIRPARLAAMLGISVNQACAELCGLMAAVGGGYEGASFTFEKLQGQNVMCFTFPADFAQRALANRQRQERWQNVQECLRFAVRGLKILTAFGLILSLLILLIAAIAGVMAVLIASQNDRGGRGRHLVLRQLHSLFYTARQLLWCYALFAPDMGEDGQQDPFLRETAYDLALICSVCCGNPASIFWMVRARQLSNRRHRIYRGWSTSAGSSWGSRNATAETSSSGAYGIEGVTLIRRGDNDTTTVLGMDSSTEHRGLLSVAVEFLFGPTPFHPPGVETDKWKLRAAVIVESGTARGDGGITLRAMAPYADEPPASMENTAQIVQQGLLQVAFLNGVPKQQDVDDSTLGESNVANDNKTLAVFVFPELMAESATVLRYEPRPDDAYNGTFLSMLYMQPNLEQGRRLTTRRATVSDLASFWKEPYYHFTRLSAAQFMYCLGLGLLNAVGVFWFGQSLQPAGVLGPLVQGVVRTILVRGLLPVLSFYAKLFFVLPVVRLVLVWYLNHVRRQRNARREQLSRELKASATTIL